MFITCSYPKTTKIPVFQFFVLKVWPALIYLESFLVEHHVCAILT